MNRFLGYVAERQAIFDRRAAGQPRPWTDDPILANHKFCCVIRDDDRTSREAKEFFLSISEDLRTGGILGFRTYNRVETARALLRAGWPETRAEIRAVIDSLPTAINSLAYKISIRGGNGLFNLEAIAGAIAVAIRTARRGDFAVRRSAENTALAVRGAVGTGPFISYQVVQDLRWVFGPYEDEQDWCILGIGATRALCRLAGNYSPQSWQERTGQAKNVATFKKTLGFGPTTDDMVLHTAARRRLQEIHSQTNLPNLMEVEHNLCEWDKYERIKSGEGTGRRWKPKEDQ